MQEGLFQVLIMTVLTMLFLIKDRHKDLYIMGLNIVVLNMVDRLQEQEQLLIMLETFMQEDIPVLDHMEHMQDSLTVLSIQVVLYVINLQD